MNQIHEMLYMSNNTKTTALAKKQNVFSKKNETLGCVASPVAKTSIDKVDFVKLDTKLIIIPIDRNMQINMYEVSWEISVLNMLPYLSILR